MKWYKHQIYSTIVVAIYVVVVMWMDNPELGPFTLVSIFLSSLPDIDQKMKMWELDLETNKWEQSAKHRHWFWHSASIPIFSFLLGFLHGNFVGVGEFCLAIGMHLVCDYKLPWKGKQSGTYLIYKWRGDRMTAKNSNAYLFLNALICLVIAVTCLFL